MRSKSLAYLVNLSAIERQDTPIRGTLFEPSPAAPRSGLAVLVTGASPALTIHSRMQVTQVIFFASLVYYMRPTEEHSFLEDRQQANHGEWDELDLLLRSVD
jgi:hypothetical protein